MRLLILAPIALLAACATTNAARPAVEIRTVVKTVEITKPCPVTKPVRPSKLGTLPTDANKALALVGAKLAEYAAPGKYADRADAAIDTCKKAGN